MFQWFRRNFITGFYPTASVSSRVYLSAQQTPRVLETLSAALVTFQRRFTQQQHPPGQQPPPPPPPPPQEPGQG